MKFKNEDEKLNVINEIAKSLVTPETKAFFSELNIDIPDGATFETLPKQLKSQVTEIATKLVPLIDKDFSLLKFFDVSTGILRELELAYFYGHAVENLGIDPRTEQTNDNFDRALSILHNCDYEFTQKAIKDLKQKKIDLFTELKNEHLQDVLDVSGDALNSSSKSYLEEDYHGNVESPFEHRLLCVMLLKSIGKFEKDGKLENVKGLGGGYFNDGDNYGITFTFNGTNYSFSDKEVENETVRIPHNAKQLEIIKKINESCDNRYVIKISDEGSLENASQPGAN